MGGCICTESNIVATTNGSLAQFQYGDSNGLIGTSIDTSRANRLRLQGILNGFSLNGSQISMFQTLGGATSVGGMSPFITIPWGCLA